MKEFYITDQNGMSQIVLTREQLKEGIVLKFATPAHCSLNTAFSAPVDIRIAVAKDPSKIKTTVKGHPNCNWGECNSCHVVSCPIYLECELEEPFYEETE